jgi:hypothetical protein
MTRADSVNAPGDRLPRDPPRAEARHLRSDDQALQIQGRQIPAGDLPNDARTFRPPVFRSILFPPGLESARAERSNQPVCFVDLNLDEVIAAVVANRDEEILRPLFYSTYRNEEIIRYRQAVFADLERSEAFRIFPVFCEAMRMARADLAYADKIYSKRHRHAVILSAVGLYCEAVRSLLHNLESLALRSAGLRNLRIDGDDGLAFCLSGHDLRIDVLELRVNPAGGRAASRGRRWRGALWRCARLRLRLRWVRRRVRHVSDLSSGRSP